MLLPPGLPVSAPLSRTKVMGLPSDIDAPLPAKQSSSRAHARAQRLLQLQEEERIEEERALIMTMYHLDTLVSPFETVKTDFADLDGVACPFLSTPFCDTPKHSSPRPTRNLRPAPHPPTWSHHPPLAPESTIRAALYSSRRGTLPSSFTAQGSSPLDGTRSRGRASSRRRRRVSTERQPCKA